MKVAIIIPARFASTRFPGKPLALIQGVPMIKRVWEKCIQALDRSDVYVATDSDKVASVCKENKIQFVMTSPNCLTGTDRVAEAATKLNYDIYINVQGDEPLVLPSDITKIIEAAKKNPEQVINACCEIKDSSEFFNQNIPKVVFATNGNLMYMSRAPIPTNKQNEFCKAFKQVCIYGLNNKALRQYTSVSEKTPFESIEDIEILRFLEMGASVKIIEVSEASVAVDTQKDLVKVNNILNGDK